VCIALRTIVAHNIAQNRPDSFPPHPPDNHGTIVQFSYRPDALSAPNHQYQNTKGNSTALTPIRESHPLSSSFLVHQLLL